MDIIRQTIEDARFNELMTRESLVDDMVAYFDRTRDHSLIRDAIKVRFGLGIKAKEDPNNTAAAPIETYVREGFTTQVNSGITEAISIGLGNKIIGAIATLFTERGQKFSLVHETVEDVESAEELLMQNRDAGQFTTSVADADRRAVECGSSAILLTYDVQNVVYQVFSPSRVRIFHADTIIEGDKVRAVDKTDIEDASVVIFRLSQVGQDRWTWLAIFGRSREYDRGRYTMFTASNTFTEVPAIGAEDVIMDWQTETGEYANPLTDWALQNPDDDLPEYPVVIVHSGIPTIDEVMPVSYSLYNDCKEFDVSASHLLSTANDAARGTFAVTRVEQARSMPLPRTIVGAVEFPPGMTGEYIAHGAADSNVAWEQIQDMQISFASGFGVPDYMVVSKDHTLDASSGVALQVKTRPLIKNRERRVELNRPSVRRIFEIEKAYIQLFNEDNNAEATLLGECEQTWEPGDLVLPVNKKEHIDGIIALMDKGLLDTIAGLREYYQTPTDQEAIEIYEKMKERAQEFPPLVEKEEPKKQIGLLNRPKTV
jgi:hypothetical protein